MKRSTEETRAKRSHGKAFQTITQVKDRASWAMSHRREVTSSACMKHIDLTPLQFLKFYFCNSIYSLRDC